ncbi:MAG: MutT/nudix family protein [Thermoleophilia bacterium]|nr:MutT/nudix family protein [Thermoleophilia bacterium]
MTPDITPPDSLADWRVCPVCAGDVELMQTTPGEQPQLVCRGRCGRPWYANPKPTANVFVERESDGRVLLVKRARDPFKGYWDAPGGFVQEGENGEQAARRELLEETGLEVGELQYVIDVADVYGSDRSMHTFNIFFRGICRDPDHARPASDVAELAWFSREELPPADEIGFDCVPRAIAAWAALIGH